jgi:hypothetical protein
MLALSAKSSFPISAAINGDGVLVWLVTARPDTTLIMMLNVSMALSRLCTWSLPNRRRPMAARNH